MAGIGFKLRRMVDEGSFAGFLQGYLYSAIIAAGPWLISIAAMAGLAWLSGGTSPLFSTTIVYVYSFTLIFVGLFQFTVTRYLSDRLYAGDTEAHLPAFLTTWVISVIPQGTLFYVLTTLLKAPPAFRLHAVALYGIVATMWVALIFLGVVRAYRLVVASFVVGGMMSVAFATLLGRWFALPGEHASQTGMLMGYAVGQACGLLVLLWVLFAEFRMQRFWEPQVLRYLRVYPYLTTAGLVYYAGMWMDKFVLRFSSRGEMVAPPFLYAAHSYEMADFVAQLTVIPALAVFFLRVETDFFERFRDFYALIEHKGSLAQIETARLRMIEAIKGGAGRLLVAQGLITVLAVLLAPALFFRLELDDLTLRLARLQMVAVFFQTLMFCVSVVLMYFELYTEACVTMAAFLVCNLLLTLALLPLGPTWDGLGFVGAGVASSGLGAFLLALRLRRIDYITFVRQPIANLVTLPPERLSPGPAPGEYTYLRGRSS